MWSLLDVCWRVAFSLCQWSVKFFFLVLWWPQSSLDHLVTLESRERCQIVLKLEMMRRCKTYIQMYMLAVIAILC